MKKISILLFFVAVFYGAKAADFEIAKYGAVGDGLTLNSQAIQKAIDACYQSGAVG